MTVEIPGYKIERVLGEGGMSTVYLAEQVSLERKVALKVMSPRLMATKETRERFLQEARITSRLMHPNIVSVYDVGLHQGHCYLAMEYVDGLDLKKARKSLSVSARINVVMDIAKALNYAGSKGYVHRDIKPENIMLNGQDKRAVLMDFGIARTIESDLSLTQTGTAIGTPHYMSPEQARGKKVDARSDLYSLGVVLYYLLVGKVPYEADSAVAVGIKHLTNPIPNLPEDLKDLQPILNRLMAKAPEDRYQSADALIDDLRAMDTTVMQAITGDSLKTTAKVISPRERLQKKRFYIAFAAACFVFCSGLLLSFWFDNQNQEPVVVLTVEQVPEINSAQALVDESQRDESSKPFWRKLGSSVSKVFKKKKAEPETSPKTELEQLQVLLKALEQKPGDEQLSQRAQLLLKQILESINHQYSSGQFERAEDALAQLKQDVSPSFSSQLQATTKRFKHRQAIEKIMAQADKAYSGGFWVGENKRGALGLYQQVLQIDEEIVPARERIQNINDLLLQQARQHMAEGKLEQAQVLARKVEANQDGAQVLLEQIKQLKARSESQVADASNIDKANYYLEKGALYAPEQANAYYYFKEALRSTDSAEQGQKGLERVHRALVNEVDKLIASQSFKQARSLLNGATEARGHDGQIELMLFRVDEAEAAQRYAR